MISKAQIQNDYNKQMIISNFTPNARIGKSCLICNEYTELNTKEYALLSIGKDVVKICPKCKQAVMKVRKEMEEND